MNRSKFFWRNLILFIICMSYICIFCVFAYVYHFPCRTILNFLACPFLFFDGCVLGVIILVFVLTWHKSLKWYVYPILIIMVVSSFFFAGHQAYIASRSRNEFILSFGGKHQIKILGEALIKYANNHDGYLPDAEQWCDALLKDSNTLKKDDFRHPKFEELGLGTCNFAFNKNVSNMRLSDIPNDMILIFEADGSWNLAGGPELLQTRYRYFGCLNMFLVNGDICQLYLCRDIRKGLAPDVICDITPCWKQ
jgi:hypothetical protein